MNLMNKRKCKIELIITNIPEMNMYAELHNRSKGLK